jgi:hypothetical protein
MTLRDALQKLYGTRTNKVDGVECIEPSATCIADTRWISVHNGQEFETGARESRSLHFPEGLSVYTKSRIVRLINS